MRLCVVGDESDFSARYVAWLAERRGVEVLLLGEDRLGFDWWFEMCEEGRSGAIVMGDRSLSLSEVDAAFVRLNPEPAVSDAIGLDDDVRPVYLLERRHGLHWFLERAHFTVVNRPSAGRSNLSKPYQMSLLDEMGLRVPPWIVTNNAKAARGFLDSWPDGAVYKACSGLRSHVRQADESLLGRLAEGSSPVVVQRYIRGVDVRVHTVGARAFATEIRSESVDYRFDEETTRYAETDAPKELIDRCVAAAVSEGLALAGFDFRRDPDGGWWCLEMNPVPTFLPYEAMTGHPIGDAILDVLLPEARLQRDRSPLLSGSDFSVSSN
jgi:glutathione synthase/RimK-type ligase-like ATP-grasp enzyme